MFRVLLNAMGVGFRVQGCFFHAMGSGFRVEGFRVLRLGLWV